MKYLKVFSDFLDVMTPLTNEEAGALFRAMLAYSRDGTESELSGNERYLWLVAKQHMDREKAAWEDKVKHLKRGSVPVSTEIAPVSETPCPVSENDCPVSGTDRAVPEASCPVRREDKEKEKDKDKDKDKDISFLSSEPVPEPPAPAGGEEKKETHPSLEDIIRYSQDTFLPVDARHFYDYYEANGWRIGQNPMRDWRAALRAWARNAPVAPRPAKAPSYVDTFREVMEHSRVKEAKPVQDLFDIHLR